MTWLDAYLSWSEAGLEAVTSVVGAVAWPVVLLILALMFRPQLSAALGALRLLNVPGMTAEFHARNQAVSDMSTALSVGTETEAPTANRRARDAHEPELNTPAPDAEHATVPSADELQALATESMAWRQKWLRDEDPVGRVARAWNDLFAAVLLYAQASGALHPDQHVIADAPRFLSAAFQLDGRIDKSAAYLIVELSELRKKVTRAQVVPSSEEAFKYEQSAARLQSYFPSKLLQVRPGA